MTKTKEVRQHNFEKPRPEYAECDALAVKIAEYVAIAINHEVYRLNDTGPYRQQYTLEKVIEALQARV
jgi:hypothetical protein